ncbi:MAG: YdcF family protein [Alphaproteobacteria bacterium]
MDWTDLNWLKPILMPPWSLALLALAAALAGGRKGRVACVLFLAGFLALATLPVADGLQRLVEARTPAAATTPPQAIVVLSADYRAVAPEYGEATIGPATLARLRHGVHLHRRTGLPLLATGGGTPERFRPSLGEAMRVAARRDFGVEMRCVEDASRNTMENASLSARILLPEGVSTVLLVTHAEHMPRSMRAFAAAGIASIPAPVGPVAPRGAEPWGLDDLLPRTRALDRSASALHELAGMLWYEAVLAWRGNASR